jgi:hypothetical protein
LPALSVAVPVTDWFAPAATICCGVQPPLGSMPESASPHVNVTVTSVLFQPYVFPWAGLRRPVMVGTVLSIDT